MPFQSHVSPMRFMFRRRTLIIIVSVICVCFLMYQLISLKELNVQMTNESKSRKRNEQNPNHNNVNENSIDAPSVDAIHYDKNNGHLRPVQELQLNNIVGVLPEHYHLYTNVRGVFRCVSSLEYIPYEYVNDDYCDCGDGTDEPSTSACPQNKFYCSNSSTQIPHRISSHKVNDGICDCCDGSDEPLNIGPPLILSAMQIEDMKNSKMKVHHPPCPELC